MAQTLLLIIVYFLSLRNLIRSYFAKDVGSANHWSHGTSARERKIWISKHMQRGRRSICDDYPEIVVSIILFRRIACGVKCEFSVWYRYLLKLLRNTEMKSNMFDMCENPLIQQRKFLWKNYW